MGFNQPKEPSEEQMNFILFYQAIYLLFLSTYLLNNDILLFTW